SGCALPTAAKEASSDAAPQPSTTYETVEQCQLKCEVQCADTTVIMTDGNERTMYNCAKPKVEEIPGESIFVALAESPFLLALLIIVSIAVLLWIIATSVFGCCMCCKLV
ncbi:hypothetical protein PENTCL1PPCAC_29276, partial [Pristionchus entomophagus]